MHLFYLRRLLACACLALIFCAGSYTGRAQTPPGNALDFNGGFVNMSSLVTPTDYTSASTFTIEFWVLPGSDFSCIYGHKPSSANQDGYAIFINTVFGNGRLYIETKNSGLASTGACDIGRWNHVALVYSGGTGTWYINGNAAGSGPFSITSNTTAGCRLGLMPFTGNYPFTGDLDELRIWNTARTQTELQNNRFNSISAATGGLVAYYKFDQGTAGGSNGAVTTLSDETANGYNGTLNSFTLSGSTSNWVESYAMVVPVAGAATNVYSNSLTANWTAPAVGTVTNYLLDVSTSATFGSFVSGYNGLNVGTVTSYTITGLTAGTTYYYRLRADKTSVTGKGGYSNAVSAATLARVPGNALHFDGNSDNVSINNTLGNFGTGNFTVEAWVRTTAAAGTIIAKRNANTNGNYFRLTMASSGKVALEIDESSPADYTGILSDAAINDGRWHHVAAMRSGTQLRLYVDGMQAATPVTVQGNPNISNSVVTTLGQFLNNSTPWDRFTGSMDEVRIYNTDLSQANIQADMVGTDIAASGNLLAYYSFNQGVAGGTNTGLTTLNDQSGKGNSGTLNTFTLSGSASNWVESYAMVVPVAAAATNITSGKFTANWSAPLVGVAEGYLLDVATDAAFTSFVSGYNGFNAGTSTSATVTGLTPLTNYYYRVRAEKSSVTGQGAPSLTISTATIAAYTWTGATSIDWNTAGNWNHNAVPAATEVVVLPSGTTFAPSLNNASYSVRDLTISSGQTLTLGSGSLNLSGSLVNNGTVMGTTGAVNLNGTAAQAISGTGTISRLTLNNATGATIASGSNMQSITGMLTLTSGTLTTNGNLTLKSVSAMGTAMVGPVSGAISGNVTVERYHSAPTGGVTTQRAWRLVTAPVKGNTNNSVYYNWQNNGTNNGTGVEVWAPGGGTGIVTGGSAASLRRYNPSANTYQNVTNTQTEALFDNTKNYGFLVFVSGSYGSGNVNVNAGGAATVAKATGALLTGTQTYSFGSMNAGALQLVGNPYACPIDFEQVYTNAGNANISPKFWVVDPNLNEIGGYVLVQRTSVNTYTKVPATGTAQDQYIQNGQAFFVEATAAATTTLNIEENDKYTTSQTAVFRMNNGSFEQLAVNLNAVPATGSPVLIDGALVNCHNNYSLAMNNNEDAFKFPNPNESISILRSGSRLALDGRPLLDHGDTVHVAFTGMRQRSYELVLSPVNIDAPALTATLYDHFLNVSMPVSLSAGLVYPFAVTGNPSAAADNRFEIVFSNLTPLEVRFVNLGARVQNNTVEVSWLIDKESGIGHYEVERSGNGRAFSSLGTVTATGSSSYSYNDAAPLDGNNYYRIRAVARSTKTVYSNIVQVNRNGAGPQLSSYPNPASGGTLQVNLANVDKGSYHITLMNAAGQQVLRQQLQHDGGSSTRPLDIEALAAGAYSMMLTNAAGEQIAIQQLVKQ